MSPHIHPPTLQQQTPTCPSRVSFSHRIVTALAVLTMLWPGLALAGENDADAPGHAHHHQHAHQHGHQHAHNGTVQAPGGTVHQAPTQAASYLENKGQWHERVHFRADFGNLSVFAEGDRITYALISLEDLDAAHDLRHDREHENQLEALRNFPIRGHAFSLLPIAGRMSQPQGLEALPTRYSFFKGQDPARWASGVQGFEGVVLPDIWPGIDWRLGASGGRAKYEFKVAPGSNPSAILLRYEGLEALALNDGALTLSTSLGDLTEAAPYAYQRDVQGREIPVPCRFVLEDGIISFELPEGYDASRPLVIDPVLVGSTYSGMGGSSQYGFTATFAPNEDMFGGGEAFGTGFPTSPGAFQTTFGGSVDMAISRFTPNADAVLWASYIGGSSNDLPHSMIADDAGNLVVMGTSSSSGYPVTPGAYASSLSGGSDIVVSKLSPDGMTLLNSTFIGGGNDDGSNGDFSLLPNYGDQHRGEVNFDGAGNILVASVTESNDFPTTSGAYDATIGGSQDAIVFSMTPDLGTLNWSTFLGGSNSEAGCALKVDFSGNVVVVGATKSTDFPTTVGAWITGYGGGTSDGFMARLNSTGSVLDASTYIGFNSQEIAYFVEIDEDGYAYAAGNCGPSFPVSPGVYNVPNSTQFVLKMMNDFSAPVWSTQYGAGTGSGQEMAPTAFLVDICGNIYFGGFTEENLPVTADALQSAVDPSGDFHFLVMQPDALGLLYGTFFGGSGWEHVDGGTSRYSKNGIVYQASCTNSTDFPVTPVSTYPTSGAGWDRVTFAIDFEFAGVSASFAALGGTISGCVPFTVDFENLSNGSDVHLWDFGTGDPSDTSSLFEPTFTFVDTGFYEVTLIASTSDTASTCADSDTATLLIEVHDRRIEAALDFVQDCSINSVDFSNLSNPPGSAAWDFGDGGSSSASDPTHVYVPGSSYTVTLTVTDSSTCNFSDVADTTLFAYPELIADFSLPPEGCAPWTVEPDNTSSSSVADFLWELGDGTTSTDFEPSWTLNPGGAYTITLVATDSLTCNQVDTFQMPIDIGITPLADFETGTAEPIPGSPVVFLDESTDATSWNWAFGDGLTSTLQNPEHTFQIAGNYVVCLTAVSDDGCEDEFCKEINIAQQVFMPNAFSPNGDGVNDHFSPISQFALNNYHFQIFNRWGALIFEATEPDTGWDGTYKGVEQEGGVYIYVLRAAEIEGVFKGTVTLVR